MAGVKIACLVALCMVVVVAPYAEAVTCGQVQGSLAQCLGYLRNGGAVPVPCCNGVRAINAAAQTPNDRKQTCVCLQQASNSITGINLPNAASLPGKCGVNVPYKISPSTDCSKVDICPRCGLTSEDLNHLFRTCTTSQNLWIAIKDRSWWEEGCDRPILEWITSNVQIKSDYFHKKWQLVFIITLWQIWNDRKRLVFDNLNPSIQFSLKSIRNYVHEIDEAYQSVLHPRPHHPRLIHWLCPSAGTLKLNVDGCSKGDPGQAGYGGLLRDDTGLWLWGFYGKLGHCYSLEAELWAIYRGLTILFQKGTKDVVIESDSELAISQLQNGPCLNSPCKALIEDAKFLLKRCNCSLQYTPREGNKCADWLANMGVSQDDHVLVLEEPPEEVKALLIADMTGTSVLRD